MLYWIAGVMNMKNKMKKLITITTTLIASISQIGCGDLLGCGDLQHGTFRKTIQSNHFTKEIQTETELSQTCYEGGPSTGIFKFKLDTEKQSWITDGWALEGKDAENFAKLWIGYDSNMDYLVRPDCTQPAENTDELNCFIAFHTAPKGSPYVEQAASNLVFKYEFIMQKK